MRRNGEREKMSRTEWWTSHVVVRVSTKQHEGHESSGGGQGVQRGRCIRGGGAHVIGLPGQARLCIEVIVDGSD